MGEDPLSDAVRRHPAAGPTRLPRLPTEPTWLCDGAFVDEFGRTWHCGHACHPTAHRHQAWLFTAPDGEPGEVGWDHRLEWSDQW